MPIYFHAQENKISYGRKSGGTKQAFIIDME
jgi:hypothetical protein